MTDYITLRNIFEMAEVLSLESDDLLEIYAFDERNNSNAVVTFRFNTEGELLNEVNVQE